jgi:hypothetical protein
MIDLLTSTEFLITLAVFLVCGVIVGYQVWVERRPRKDLMPRMISGTPIMLVFGFITLLAMVHMINLLGIHTGRTPRF